MESRPWESSQHQSHRHLQQDGNFEYVFFLMKLILIFKIDFYFHLRNDIYIFKKCINVFPKSTNKKGH